MEAAALAGKIRAVNLQTFREGKGARVSTRFRWVG
jgi:hypothetical protein